MRKLWLLLTVLVFLLSGCAPSTFIVNNGIRAYYFGSESKGAYRMLCETGDLIKVLRNAELPEEIKKDLYEYACTEQRSNKKVISLYTFLTPEEKKNLKRAFVEQGYTINSVPC